MKLENMPFNTGDIVKPISRDHYSWINIGQKVKVIRNEPGTFQGDIYTIVESLDGKQKAVGHYWRFEKIGDN